MSSTRNEDLKIVVVDDSDLSRNSLIEILEKNGFNVVGQASSANEAVPLLGTGANLFLIDIVMPEVSGIELSKIISENSKQAKIIMMSSLNMESIIIESISNGAVDFLSKPFSEKDLIRSVEKIEIEMEKDN
ncbi:response regulator [Halobacteriovorax marinus]|uniref:Chemotaxis protein cheY homologue n=1 Tax=Halobacteriovorax marinus (strain ATCC BAA-682 / DSM 15412 / SJ) TaxID=862908 RepID=E1X2S7_HALMS|nr:response regulator [Halobacteriovorax marinus]ATH06556.1 response regulator [Halobacteriovorax marinus]CBW25122.1 chemotaxis protein cheY homologue [Halobacteriovorax marinus SJ]